MAENWFFLKKKKKRIETIAVREYLFYALKKGKYRRDTLHGRKVDKDFAKN